MDEIKDRFSPENTPASMDAPEELNPSPDQSRFETQTQSSSETTSSLPPSGNKVPKILILVLVLLFAIIVGGGYLFLQNLKQKPTIQNSDQSTNQESPTPSPDLTSGWKKYTNSVFKIEFKIPPNFMIYEGSNYKLAIIKEQPEKIMAPHEIKSDIQIWVNPNRDGEYGNYEEAILNRKSKDRYPSNLQITQKDKYVLFTGWWPGPFSEGNYYATEALIKYGDGAISFTQQHEPNENTLLMEQILSTFKFVE